MIMRAVRQSRDIAVISDDEESYGEGPEESYCSIIWKNNEKEETGIVRVSSRIPTFKEVREAMIEQLSGSDHLLPTDSFVFCVYSLVVSSTQEQWSIRKLEVVGRGTIQCPYKVVVKLV